MNVNWKRLFTILGVVIVTATVLGFLMYSGLIRIIQDKEQEIQLLANRSNEISTQYLQESQEKKAKAAEAAKTTQKPRSTTTLSSEETTTSEDTNTQPQAQSQIYYFYNPSCGACIAQEPIVLELQAEGIPFIWCNIISNPSYISQYSITATPTFILNNNRRNFSTKTQLQTFWNTYK